MIMKTILTILFVILCYQSIKANDGISEKVREKLIIDSKILSERREIIIHLPPDYHKTQQSYPVIYITDAEIQMDHTSASANFLYGQHRMPQAIIVGIVNTDRNRDLRPTNLQNANNSSEGADRFLNFIEEELITTINQQYRTIPYKILSGTSFGGLFAVHTLATKPDLFNAYIAISPSLWWDNSITLERIKAFLATQSPDQSDLPPRKLYLSLANEEPTMSAPYDELLAILTGASPDLLIWNERRFAAETHNSGVMLSQYYSLSAIFKVWAIPDSPQTLDDLLTRYQAMSGQLQTPLTLPEDRAIGYGTWLYYLNQQADAEEMFVWVTNTYPKSATGHHSLGLIYEKSGKLKKAYKSFQRTYTLSKMDNTESSSDFEQSLRRAKKALE
jgi:predicted alpha/beta superfamily hydrolase